MTKLGKEINADQLFVDRSLDMAAAERFANQDREFFAVENDRSEDAQLLHYEEDGANNRLKIREKALKYEQMRMSDRPILTEEDLVFENEDDVQKMGSNMELMRQERSQKDVLENPILENVRTVLRKLLNQTGLGK